MPNNKIERKRILDNSMDDIPTDPCVKLRNRLGNSKSLSASTMHSGMHPLKSGNVPCPSKKSSDSEYNDAHMKDMTDEFSSPQDQNDSEFLDTGFTLIGYTFFLQIALHIMTFILNSLSYRYLDTASLGLVNVRLGLFYSTLVFTAREAFRRACLSRGGELINTNKRLLNNKLFSSNVNTTSTSHPISEDSVDISQLAENYTNIGIEKTCQCLLQYKQQLHGILNLAWLVLPTGLIMATLLCIVWIFILPSPSSLIGGAVGGESSHSEFSVTAATIEYRYLICIIVYTLSGFLELTTEPFWLLCQLSHEVRVRIFIEAFANTARVIGIVSAIFAVPSEYAVYSLSIPQLLHGSTLLASYLMYFHYGISRSDTTNEWQLKGIPGITSLNDILPHYVQYTIDRPGLQLVRNFFGQCILKQLLTEGERYLISAFHLISFTDQGVYDLVNNLGSLAARLLFLPLEESCHFTFSQCLKRDVPPSLQDKKLLADVFRILRTALRTSSLVAWIGVTFAQANSRLLLMIYAGHRLADYPAAVNLLQLYSAYVLLLAWNGSTEALLNSAMSTDEVLRHNQRLVIFSVIFLCANWFLVPIFNVYGFVLANCINMLTRITYSVYYIRRYIRRIDEPVNNHIIAKDNNLKSFPLKNNRPSPSSDTQGCVKDTPQLTKISLLSLMLPSWNEASVLCISLLCTLISQHFFCCSSGTLWMIIHAGITFAFLCLVLTVMYHEEVDLLQLIRSELLRRKSR
uniref:Protein RFT1 homolog n=1 Tax=Trichobilharzia regenti TaxID=157069 RepID=A0AA85KEI4_TRIRE|nr:unnamed protein product [Trichobilharzia regenti]